jgi:lysophospholipase L1-like esterase
VNPAIRNPRPAADAPFASRRARLAALVLIVLPSCAAPAVRSMPDSNAEPMTQVRFLALGDSYTIGEGVAAPERWPSQLAAMMRTRGVPVAEPEIVARTGWTTEELQNGVAQAAPRGPYQLVTLMIGVNNQYRGLGVDEYRTQFAALLADAVGFAGGEPKRVIVLSIPDWGVTPYANGRDRDRIASEIDLFNAVNRGEAQRVGTRYVDVTSRSRDVAADSTLVGPDGLHPTGRMYDGWASDALPQALQAVGFRKH